MPQIPARRPLASLRLKTAQLLLFTAISIIFFLEIARAERPAPENFPIGIILDADQGRVLYARSANARWYPASLTKMMTVYLAFREIANGRLRLEDGIVVSPIAARQPPSKFGLRAGETVTVAEAIGAAIVASANDAAVALAERIAGNETDFAKQMTETAITLGMTRSSFRNATGLPDNAQVTTAHDMATLAFALYRDYPQFFHFFSMRNIVINGRSALTVNGMLGNYRGADGMKTGFTCSAGYNLVASAVHDGRRLIGVLLGSANRFERQQRMRALLDRGFEIEPEDKPLLQDIALHIEDSENAPPPNRLGNGECDIASYAEGETGAVHKAVRSSGWGVVLGAFSNPGEAAAVITRYKKQFAGVLRSASPAVMKHHFEGIVRYSAILVGLSQNAAGNACKTLWQKNVYCLALSPQTLADPRAIWR